MQAAEVAERLDSKPPPGTGEELHRQGFALGSILGSGSFARCYLVSRAGQTYVAKIQRYAHLSKSCKELAIREVRIMMDISKQPHPHLVRWRQTFKDGPDLCIIMDYCNSGDLAEQIEQQKLRGSAFDEAQLSAWLLQMLSAIDYLHFHDVLHRDIKPRNTFLHVKTTRAAPVIKLGDLGLSKKVEDALAHSKAMVHTQCGSPQYVAPEVHMGVAYNYGVDIWGVGCVLYELMMLDFAFKGRTREEVCRSIVYGRYSAIDTANWSPELVNMLQHMLTVKMAARPTALELLAHPYFTHRHGGIEGKLTFAAMRHRLLTPSNAEQHTTEAMQPDG